MKKIGILGYGIVGKSVHHFLETFFKDVLITVWDKRSFDGSSFYSPSKISLSDFIAFQDELVVSPGFELDSHSLDSQKVFCELDFFAQYCTAKTISITGSFGKTTVTKLLTLLINRLRFDGNISIKAVEGGNVGRGMLDLISSREDFDYAVLELSSFQLERSKTFAPDIGMLLNISPNHLDRHKTMDFYLDAKWNVFVHQRSDQHSILPLSLFDQGFDLKSKIQGLRSQIWVTTIDPIEYDDVFTRVGRAVNLVELRGHELWVTRVSGVSQRIAVLPFSDSTFKENWVMVFAALVILQVDTISLSTSLAAESCILDYHHRIEPCGTYKDVDFYNDSKSTVIETTWAAVKKLLAKKRPVIVILGGLSKGVDRSHLNRQLALEPDVKKIYCYGPECAPFLTAACFATLEEILDDVFSMMEPGDQVLFSPAGASFDLYENYGHRGDVFKELVKARIKVLLSENYVDRDNVVQEFGILPLKTIE